MRIDLTSKSMQIVRYFLDALALEAAPEQKWADYGQDLRNLLASFTHAMGRSLSTAWSIERLTSATCCFVESGKWWGGNHGFARWRRDLVTQIATAKRGSCSLWSLKVFFFLRIGQHYSSGFCHKIRGRTILLVGELSKIPKLRNGKVLPAVLESWTEKFFL